MSTKKQEPSPRAKAFIKKLAEYLVADQAKMSIGLSLGNPEAKKWAELRGQTPLHGYPTVAEAEQQLAEWFAKGMP